jgi:hypothetical protein
MTQLALAALLVVAGQAQQPGTPGGRPYSGRGASAATMIEGQWTLVYGEREGHRLDKTTNVTIHDNRLTFDMNGQQHNWRLEFGPRETLRAWHEGEGARTGAGTSGATGKSGTAGTTTGREAAEGAHRGVYVLSGNYLCLSLERGMAGARTAAGAAGPATERPNRTGTGGVGNREGGAAGTVTAPGAMSAPHENRFFVLILHRQGGATGERPGR